MPKVGVVTDREVRELQLLCALLLEERLELVGRYYWCRSISTNKRVRRVAYGLWELTALVRAGLVRRRVVSKTSDLGRSLPSEWFGFGNIHVYSFGSAEGERLGELAEDQEEALGLLLIQMDFSSALETVRLVIAQDSDSEKKFREVVEHITPESLRGAV